MPTTFRASFEFHNISEESVQAIKKGMDSDKPVRMTIEFLPDELEDRRAEAFAGADDANTVRLNFCRGALIELAGKKVDTA